MISRVLLYMLPRRLSLPGAGVALSGRWYTPADACYGLAVIAHRMWIVLTSAYGYVGGDQDNPVVLMLVRHFLAQQMHVVTYNARGVAGSEGRISWTMRPECEDMQSVVQYAMEHASLATPTPTLYVVGYSAGALQASTVRPKLTYGAWAHAHLHYLLLAYPLGVRWLLTCLQTGYYVFALDALLRDEHMGLTIVYGTSDQFTGASSYAAWRRHLLALRPTLDVHALAMDHFLRTAPMQQALCAALPRRAAEH